MVDLATELGLVSDEERGLATDSDFDRPDNPAPRPVQRRRPDAPTATMVRTRDGHCRFPGCSVPAPRCQLDHVVPFDHRRPFAGGWTIAANLQCLCQFHHNLKTMGRCRATMLGGGTVVWTSRYGTRAVTLPGGAFARDPENWLVPRLPRRRRAGRTAVAHRDVEPPPV
ncbi:HNH endonuclease signature motif containing protein [Rhodococcus sp. ACT016]|uniref:HNH endonuclease signature motif containing protein n=1 Tax=Rhodococcus sp. ACT016 TaxID=3134808 RepID=UPI003D280431